MAGHDKERDRGHDHRSNGSTVQAASAELARQGTEDLRRLSSFLGSTPVAPAILDDASAPCRKVMGVPGQRWQAWRNGAEYKEARKIGDKYGKFRAFAVDGLPQ